MPGTAVEVISNLTREVGEAKTVMTSATDLIDGFQARLDAGIAAALANGATEAELAPLSGLSTDLDNEGTKLAAAVARNTVAANEPPQPPVG